MVTTLDGFLHVSRATIRLTPPSSPAPVWDTPLKDHNQRTCIWNRFHLCLSIMLFILFQLYLASCRGVCLYCLSTNQPEKCVSPVSFLSLEESICLLQIRIHHYLVPRWGRTEVDGAFVLFVLVVAT